MIVQLPDNPQIRMTERTGYPKPQRVEAVCAECGEPIYSGETVYTLNGKLICIDCVTEEIFSNMKFDELAERLGFEPRIAEDE